MDLKNDQIMKTASLPISFISQKYGINKERVTKVSYSVAYLMDNVL